MRIGAFTYNFPHYKSQQGLLNLMVSGNRPEVIFAQDKAELKFYQSKIQTVPRHRHLVDIQDMAKVFGIPFVVYKMGDVLKRADVAMSHNLDLGVILGARVLNQKVIKAFKIGILNLHPGLIPINRGLDTIKWAIIRGMKQGVTSHLIDRHIDKGSIIGIQVIDVYPDDTLMDIHFRLEEKGQAMMIEAIGKLKKGVRLTPVTSQGFYNQYVPVRMETVLMGKFESYKQNYSTVCGLGGDG